MNEGYRRNLWRCSLTKSGIIGAGARLNCQGQPARESITDVRRRWAGTTG